MNDEELRHNYLERKRRDEVIQPVDPAGAQSRTATRLAALFADAPAESEPEDGPEPTYSQGQVISALRSCDVGLDKTKDVLHVLEQMR